MATRRIDQLNAASTLSTTDRMPVAQLQSDGTTWDTAYTTPQAIKNFVGTSSYTLPTASTTTLGGVKLDGSTITISNGVISAAAQSSTYSLPAATSSTLGGVIIPSSSGLNNSSGSITVLYGTGAGTAAQGNDSRITGAAPLASPTFTGTPAGPTASTGTNTTQLATTAFVLGQSFLTTSTLPVGSSSTLGVVKPDGTTLTNSTGAISVTYGTAANTAAQGNDSRITGAAPAANPTLTGTVTMTGASTVTAPTLSSTSDQSNNVATTQWVTNKVAAVSSGITSVAGSTGSPSAGIVTTANLFSGGVATQAGNNAMSGTNTFSGSNTFSSSVTLTGSVTFSSAPTIPAGLTLYAPLASPTFTGTPAGPTASSGTSSTQLATTAFVATAVSSATTGVSHVMGFNGDVTFTQLTSTGDSSGNKLAPLASPVFTGSPSVPGYLTTSSASSTYATKASPTFTGSVDMTGASVSVATASSGDNSSLAASTSFVANTLANGVTGTVLAGNGTAGFLTADSSGNVSIKNFFPFPVFHATSPVTGTRFKFVAPANVVLVGVQAQALNVTGTANGITLAVTYNGGTSVAGLGSVTANGNASGASSLTTAAASTSASVSANQDILVTVTVNGTWPSAGTAFVQLYGTYG